MDTDKQSNIPDLESISTKKRTHQTSDDNFNQSTNESPKLITHLTLGSKYMEPLPKLPTF